MLVNGFTAAWLVGQPREMWSVKTEIAESFHFFRRVNFFSPFWWVAVFFFWPIYPRQIRRGRQQDSFHQSLDRFPLKETLQGMAPRGEKRLRVHINKRELCQSKQAHTALPVTRNSAPVPVLLLPRHQNLVLFWQRPELSTVNLFLSPSKLCPCMEERKINSAWVCFSPFCPC